MFTIINWNIEKDKFLIIRINVKEPVALKIFWRYGKSTFSITEIYIFSIMRVLASTSTLAM